MVEAPLGHTPAAPTPDDRGHYTTSSGTRTWDAQLEHWGMGPQTPDDGSDLPSDVRANVLPIAYDAARQMHTTPQVGAAPEQLPQPGRPDPTAWASQLGRWGMR